MLQEEPQIPNKNNAHPDPTHTSKNPKHDKFQKQSQLDFQKNYPKNIFIPMIEYLAEIGLKQQYELAVGSREEFEGKNVVSLSLIHKLMGADWFKQNVQKRVLISNISNKILMNSKIKKKLFHLQIVKSLFEVYDEDLKEFKKRISKLANSVSELPYIQDQLFEYPSSILYLVRLFYKLISPHHNNHQFNFPPFQTHSQPTPLPIDLNSTDKLLIEPLQQEPPSEQMNQNPKQGSKEEYKYYIRRIIHHFNTEQLNQNFCSNFNQISSAILERQNEVKVKYQFPLDVPAWRVFIQKVVFRCFECLKKSGKITQAMMNEWINNFKEHITSSKAFSSQSDLQTTKNAIKKQTPYYFKPLILKYYPNNY